MINQVFDIVSFLFLVVGGSIAIRTFILNQRQRKLENSFRLIRLFSDSINQNDLNNWSDIFHSASEPAGAKYGHFIYKSDQMPFEYLFSEGNIYDDYAIRRIADILELISYEYLRGTIDIHLIYFELGQLINTIHCWLSSFNAVSSEHKFVEVVYPSFNKMVVSNKNNFDKWFCKTITELE